MALLRPRQQYEDSADQQQQHSGGSPVGCSIETGETFLNSALGRFNSTPGGVDANGNDVVREETTKRT